MNQLTPTFMQPQKYFDTYTSTGRESDASANARPRWLHGPGDPLLDALLGHSNLDARRFDVWPSLCICDVAHRSAVLRHGLIEAGLHNQGEALTQDSHTPAVAAEAARSPAVATAEYGVVHGGDESTDSEAQVRAQSTSPLAPIVRKRPRPEVPPPQRRTQHSAQGVQDNNISALAIADALRPRDNAMRDQALETVECVILHIASKLREPVPPSLEEAARVLVGMDGMGSAASRMVCRAVKMWSQEVAGLGQGSPWGDTNLSSVTMDNVHLLVDMLGSAFKLSYVASPS